MPTKRIKTDGLIIKQQNIGEQDKIVTVLTRELGVIRAFARGAKSLKSPNCAGTGLLCHSELSIYVGKDKYIIEQAKLKNMFTDLRKEITRISLGEYFCELAAAICPTEQNVEEHLRLLLNALYLLGKGNVDELLIKAVVELRLASISGYMPDLLMCRECGEYETDTMYFSFSGQIMCDKCFQQAPKSGAVQVSKGIMLALRHIVFSEDKKLFSFSLSKESLKKLNYITENYLSRKVERDFQTLHFYNTIKS